MKNTYLLILSCFCFYACSSSKQQILSLENTLNISRENETIELTKEILQTKDLSLIGIKDTDNHQFAITQLVDTDNDGVDDLLLFQTNLAPNSSKKYSIQHLKQPLTFDTINYCHAYFAKERTDDLAWENDKVAYRIFGPKAEYLFKNHLKDGTLTSGVDAWLKRVDYPIINKWYKKHIEKTGSYHKDTGEGLDNFHVGSSRGIGGITIKKDSLFYVSDNFTHWKIITKGPIRTSFYVSYKKWGPTNKEVTEAKIISLDKGSHLSKFEIEITNTPNLYAGITLHKKKGVISNKPNYTSYWEPHKKSELGMGIVTTPNYFINTETYKVKQKDKSHTYINLKVIDNKTVYYSGFTWKKANLITNKKDWNTYLKHFSLKLQNPIKIHVSK